VSRPFGYETRNTSDECGNGSRIYTRIDSLIEKALLYTFFSILLLRLFIQVQANVP